MATARVVRGVLRGLGVKRRSEQRAGRMNGVEVRTCSTPLCSSSTSGPLATHTIPRATGVVGREPGLNHHNINTISTHPPTHPRLAGVTLACARACSACPRVQHAHTPGCVHGKSSKRRLPRTTKGYTPRRWRCSGALPNVSAVWRRAAPTKSCTRPRRHAAKLVRVCSAHPPPYFICV